MPSGKRARQQRQQAAAAPPPVRSKGSPGARQASPRTLAIAGGVILVVIVAVVLGIVLTQSSGGVQTTNGQNDGPNITLAAGMPAVGNASSPSALPGAADVEKLLKGIPQHVFVLGKPNAPVTLVEYIDLQCPVCQSFETSEFPTLVKKYVRTGKLKIEMQTWNIIDANDGTDDSLRGQKVTIAAAAQDKAFNFAEVLYDNQGTEGTNWLNDAMVANIASSVTGLNLSQLVSAANSSDTASVIRTIDNYANSHATATGPFSGTPNLWLAKGKGKPFFFGVGWGTSTVNSATLEAKINSLLK
jgi:protein-disulfide isomerase